jgi:hypothetical protein
METKMKIKIRKKIVKRRTKKPTRTVRVRTTQTAVTPIVVDIPAPPVAVEMKPRVRRYVSVKSVDASRGNIRWAFDEAIKSVACKRCHAEAGEPCVKSVKKREQEIGAIHIRRLKSYRKFIGAEDYQMRHGGSTLVGKTPMTLDKEEGVL